MNQLPKAEEILKAHRIWPYQLPDRWPLLLEAMQEYARTVAGLGFEAGENYALDRFGGEPNKQQFLNELFK